MRPRRTCVGAWGMTRMRGRQCCSARWRRLVRSSGIRRSCAGYRDRALRPACAAGVPGRAHVDIEQPRGEEIQWAWLDLPATPSGHGAYVLVGVLSHSGRLRRKGELESVAARRSRRPLPHTGSWPHTAWRREAKHRTVRLREYVQAPHNVVLAAFTCEGPYRSKLNRPPGTEATAILARLSGDPVVTLGSCPVLGR